MNEKSSILPSVAPQPQPKPVRRLIPNYISLFIFAFIVYSYSSSSDSADTTPVLSTGKCPVQPPSLFVGPEWNPEDDKAFVKKQVARLSGAIKISTQSYDDMGTAPEDKRLEHLGDLGDYLEKTFPLLHGKKNGIKLELINTYARLYTWQGTNPSLKPIVLMAHQDVVPVNPAAESQWTYPPFSGTWDEDGWIWGRGSADCKNTLIASMSAIEQLLSEDINYKPTRTIILSFGYDEEIGGSRSAQYLSQHLLSTYGQDGIGMILDEGFTGLDSAENFGILDSPTPSLLLPSSLLAPSLAPERKFARLGLMEKGSFSLLLEIFTPGGHSSVPPKHTSIGILSLLLTHLESHPFSIKLEQGNPVLSHLQCLDEYAGESVSEKLRGMIRDEKKWAELGEMLGEGDETGTMKAWLGTTQAVDLIQGGVKLNALPEYAQSTINYRISFLSSPQETFDRISSLLEPIVTSLNLTFVTNTTLLPSSSSLPTNNFVRLSLSKEGALKPAPPTPTEGKAWDFMGGTVKGVFGEETVISPSGMIANTDTKWYWDLTPNIYRWVPASTTLLKGFHTVDERAHVDAHLSSLKFYYRLIRNTEGWEED